MKLLTAFFLTAMAFCFAVAGESDSGTGADPKSSNERADRLFASMRDGTYKGDLSFPELKWEDIPALLERGKSTTRLKSFPSNWISSYAQDGAEEGTVALWLIDGLRRGGKWPSLNPLCLGSEKPGEKMEETSRRNLPAARKAFEEWWRKVVPRASVPASCGLPRRSGFLIRYFLTLPETTRGGAVESACKTVVGQRLKLAGMRWGEDGADALCHLRALYRSEKGQWEAFWNRDYTHN